MITCAELTELVSDYIEGRLGFWDRLRFNLHVRLCPVCMDYLRQLRLTRDTLAQLPPQPMPEEVRDELLARFRDWKRADERDPAGER